RPPAMRVAKWRLCPGIARRKRIRFAPICNRGQRHVQRMTPGGQCVLDPWRHFVEDGARDEAVALQLAPLLSEHLFGHANDRPLELAEAKRSGRQLPEDGHLPLPADRIEGRPDPTFVIRLRHQSMSRSMQYSPMGKYLTFPSVLVLREGEP